MPNDRRGRLAWCTTAAALAAIVGCGDSSQDDDETSTGAPETTAADSTTGEFEQCLPAVIPDVVLDLVVDPPLSEADAAGVQYSGTCTVSGVGAPVAMAHELSFACTGAGGPAADWSVTATVTGLPGMPPPQVVLDAELELSIAYAAADDEFSAIALHAGDVLVLAVANGNVLDLGDQSMWSPVQVSAPTDQQCGATSDDCTARNRLEFDGVVAATLDCFDHHALATDSYDVLVGNAFTVIESCDVVGNPARYEFAVVRRDP
jgi:hypothetical protein